MALLCGVVAALVVAWGWRQGWLVEVAAHVRSSRSGAPAVGAGAAQPTAGPADIERLGTLRSESLGSARAVRMTVTPFADLDALRGLDGVRAAVQRAETDGYAAYAYAEARLARARGEVPVEALDALAARLTPNARGKAAAERAVASDRESSSWDGAWLTPEQWLALGSRYNLPWTDAARRSFREAYRTAYAAARGTDAP